jgi:thiamine pyrophosphate-dependent acetolactate synthase large subunit-like protein
VLADAKAAAGALSRALQQRSHQAAGFRSPELANQIKQRQWRNEPYDDASTDEFIDPRTLSIAVHNALPPNRQVAVDSGHFLGYPAMYLDVSSARQWVFPNGFQAVGLGLGNAIGAAIANTDVPTVAAIGDGGAFMALAEIETAVRLKLGNLLVLIYDDAAYGAEVHHFAPMGHDVSRVKFPDADLAAIAQAAGARAAIVRDPTDLSVIDDWLAQRSGHPLVLDAKVNPTICAEWLEEAFRAG